MSDARKSGRSGRDNELISNRAAAILMPIFIVVIIGVLMVVCTGSKAGPGKSHIGLVILVAAVPLFAVGVLAAQPMPSGRLRMTPASVALLVVVYLSAVVGLAGVAGQIVRWVDPADYHGRFGARVTAQLTDPCTNATTVHQRSGLEGADADIVCENATWQQGGAQHVGTIVIGWDDTDIYSDHPTDTGINWRHPTQRDRVDAYVIGDKGYSVARVGKAEPVGLWGGVPLWTLAAVLVAGLAAWGLRRFREAPGAADSPPSP
jgi:hypothetical protein